VDHSLRAAADFMASRILIHEENPTGRA